MSNWVRNEDGSIQSKQSQFEEFKRTHFKKWDSYKKKYVWIEVGSEQHKKILKNKPTGKRVLSADIQVDAEIAQRWYHSEEWKKVRSNHIRSVYEKNGTRKCNHCGAEGKSVYMCVDHIYPIRRYWSMRLDPNNLQDLCADCNKLKLNSMDSLVAERRLIKKDGRWVVLEVKEEPFVCPDWLKDKTPFDWEEQEQPKTLKPEILSIHSNRNQSNDNP